MAARLGQRVRPECVKVRRLVALRSVVNMAGTIGVVAWALDVESPRAEPYRDTGGPGDAGWRAMLALVKRDAESGRPKPVRGLAIVRLLHDLALRRGELVALDLADSTSRPPPWR